MYESSPITKKYLNTAIKKIDDTNCEKIISSFQYLINIQRPAG